MHKDFGDAFPSVDELIDDFIDEIPDGKLYLRGVVRPIPCPLEILTENVGIDYW